MKQRTGMKNILSVGRLAVGVLLVGALSANAAEQVVQNDTVTDFGEAVIVGDFVFTEQAGTRLTSPCDGSIVAVQIVWLEGTPGNPQSLEQAIRISADDGVFPTPGTQLLLLEGPVMTPGGINEWRYVDENQTLPINVPVTSGQNFFVALEFANPTNVGGGGPSVVRDIDGCQSGRNVLFGNPGGWMDFCFFLSGDLAIRAVVDCVEPTGACCDGNATCVNDVQTGDCQGTFDTFFLGQTCSQITCPDPIGACCNGSGGCLEGQTQDFCENILSSTYGGNSTVCADQVCDLGACCMADGSCQDVIDSACTAAGGTYQGAGTDCLTTSCPQPQGACCIGANCVADQTETACASFSGTWQGPFTLCTPDPCSACNDGDANQDGDVDLEDFAVMQDCFGSPVSAQCECLDMDNDNDVDLTDYASFATELDGVNGGPN